MKFDGCSLVVTATSYQKGRDSIIFWSLWVYSPNHLFSINILLLTNPPAQHIFELFALRLIIWRVAEALGVFVRLECG